MFHSYILKSGKTGRYYYGATADLEKRLKAHNAGKVRSTKHGRPWAIHYSEAFESMGAAMARERFFKTVDGYRYLKEQRII